MRKQACGDAVVVIHDQAGDVLDLGHVFEDKRMVFTAGLAPDVGHPAAGQDHLRADNHARQKAVQFFNEHGPVMLIRQVEQKVIELIELALGKMAGTGSIPMTFGSTPAVAMPSILALSVRPNFMTADSEAMINAAAPSLIPDA